MFRYNIWMSPQAVAHRIAQRKGACTSCGKCCSQMECPFLAMGDEGRPVCTVYGTRFWYFGTCGRYPLTQQDIDDHACPGFSFMTEDGRLVYEV